MDIFWMGVRKSTGLLVVALAILLFASHASPAFATIAVYPSKVELMSDKGKVERFEISVGNTGNRAFRTTVSAWDFARDERGIPHQIGPQDAERFRGCSSWLRLPFTTTQMVDPNGSATFQFEVNVPKDTDLGTHFCYITFASQTATRPAQQSESGVNVSAPVVYRISALLLVQVGKETDGSAPLFKRSVTVEQLDIKNVNFDRTVPIAALLENTGNVHLNLAEGSKLQILKGRYTEAEIPLQQFTLLPENTLLIPAVWKASAPVGRYTARFLGDVGLDEPVTAERTFWVVSWQVLAAIGAAILLLGVLTWLFFKRFNIRLTRKGPKDLAGV